MSHNTNNIDKVLGQKVASPTTYTPDILVREERQRNRTYLGLQDNKLPFVGYDIWNGYECSALTNSGLPVTCIAKVVYPCTNKYIVESKSMKLYWNGFNMQPMGNTPAAVLKNLKQTAERDLSKLLDTKVKVALFSQLLQSSNADRGFWEVTYEPGPVSGAESWVVLENIAAAKKKKFTVFNEEPLLLKVDATKNSEYYYYMSTLLRSNCKITHQPDSGDIYISYKGSKTVTEESLLEWIVSFRNECHFHEEIIECAFKRLYDCLEPEELVVSGFYARRGGWDIVPTRATSAALLDPNLIDPNAYYFKFPRQ